MQKVLYFYPTKDTYIDSNSKEENLSESEHYFLGFFKKSIKYRILLQYDIKDIPKDSNIIDAKLKLYCMRNDCMEKIRTFAVHPITEVWDKTTVNYLNQPPFDNSKKVQITVDSNTWDYIDIDLTEYIKEWQQNSETNNGIIIKAENENTEESLLGIGSLKQSNSAYKPRLEINISTPDNKKEINGLRRIAILTPQFFQMEGNRCQFGGGERYLIDLAKLLQKLGYEVDVFQPTSVGRWERNYEEINIYGICTSGVDRDFLIKLNKSFSEVSYDYDYHIYFNLDTIYPYVFPGSICISHGIWWDSTERDWWRSYPWYGRMFRGLDSVDLLVSVDTNTINWINAVNPELNCRKVYIPNYVDINLFKPDTQKSTDNGYIKVLYPRRLCTARGLHVTRELAVELTEEFDNIVFSFVGRGGTDAIEKRMALFCSTHNRMEYTWYEMNDMYKAYNGTDIVLIPSLYSEGTSLSLLEAMACGKPTIAGLVGGLTDLIFPGYNGYLVEINKQNLKKAIIELMENPDLRKTMGKNARAVAEKFSKEIWEERWKKVILEQFTI